jgi:hypothetical protein
MGPQKVIGQVLVTNMAHLTGSGELPAILFVDGIQASKTYGVPIRKSDGGCPHCHGPVDTVLAFNPTDSYWYLAPCPICMNFIRYYDNSGNLADFAIVKTTKTTPLDVDEDIPGQYGPGY